MDKKILMILSWLFFIGGIAISLIVSSGKSVGLWGSTTEYGSMATAGIICGIIGIVVGIILLAYTYRISSESEEKEISKENKEK